MLGTYLKLAFKVLLRRKAFTAVSLFGISFTLMVLVMATALLDHVVAPMAPEVRQERTLGVYFARMRGDDNRLSSEPGYLLLDQYTRGLPGVELMSIFSAPSLVNSYLNGTRIQSLLKRTDGEFWKILSFEFLEGGPFTAGEVAEAKAVAVINATTRRRFFGDEKAMGRTIEADGQRFQVVGVVPDVSELRTVPFAEIWAPLTTAKSDSYRRELMGGFGAIYQARRVADLPALREEFRSRMKRVELPKGYNRMLVAPETHLEHVASILLGSPLETLVAGEDGAVSLAGFWLIVGALSILFMLLPAVNLVNLSVSRILERASEIGVRKAFGASSRTLVGQFVVENVTLTLIGGLLGLVLSEIALSGLSRSGLLPYAHFALNLRVFFFGLGLAAFFGVLSGTYPAWRMSRLQPVEALKGSTR
jgi:putative ABC transport system permease protein